VFIDQACRRNTSVPQLMQVVGDGGALIILGESLEDEDIISLLRNESMDHVITDSATPDESELVVTSVKLLSGDIFGLEKYLAWGVKVHELNVGSYEEKRRALMRVSDHAREIGARRHVIAKLESVTDELLMNALYDAPAVRKGTTPAHRVEKESDDTTEPMDEAALLRWACDGRYFAVSVQDNYGELQKQAILDHLSRARAEKGKPKFAAENGGGAGLGLYFILSSVTRFIANIEPGRRTEVVCLFDLRKSGRQAEACARSLHIFRIEDESRRGEDQDEEADRDTAPSVRAVRVPEDD
jgi:hypothetical protein